MSKNLSPMSDVSPYGDLADLGDGPFEEPNIDAVDRTIAVLVGQLRGQISAAMKADGVGVRELARLLDVSPSAVSRHLNSEGDIRVSTAVLLAHALKRHWQIFLTNNTAETGHLRNYASAPFASLESGPPQPTKAFVTAHAEGPAYAVAAS